MLWRCAPAPPENGIGNRRGAWAIEIRPLKSEWLWMKFCLRLRIEHGRPHALRMHLRRAKIANSLESIGESDDAARA